MAPLMIQNIQRAESLNTMFVNVTSRRNVNNTQDVVNEKLRYFITSRLTADVEPINISLITEKDILEFINKLTTNKATGHDGSSALIPLEASHSRRQNP